MRRRPALALLGAALALALTLLLLPAPGHAEEGAPGAGPGGGGRPCHADVQAHCGDARGTPGGVRACLEEHAEELRPECREWMAAHRGRMAEGGGPGMHGACSQDRKRLCGDTPAGAERMRCMRAKRAELSPGCRAALDEAEKSAEE